MRPLSLRKRLLFAIVPVLVCYAAIETVATAIAWARWWDQSIWVFEDSGRTWRFDPLLGARLTTTPSRFGRITNGTWEFLGTARGNSRGFPDRDEFEPPRSGPGIRRYAVLGDSFTEGQYLGQSWPDRAEDLAKQRGKPVELLNLAISGGGLANWWSTLTRVIGPEGYELDGVIFAVYPGDLRRRFSMWEHRGEPHPRFGRCESWDPATFPTTLAEARPILHEHPGYILTAEEFEHVIQGQWPSQAPRRFRPYLLTTAWRALRAITARSETLPPVPEADSDPDRDRMIADVSRFLASHNLPALVIHLADRESLLSREHRNSLAEAEAQQFAESIGAQYLNGTAAFGSLSPGQIRAQFLPYDGHWSQAGSNRFAEYVVPNLGRIDIPVAPNPTAH